MAGFNKFHFSGKGPIKLKTKGFHTFDKSIIKTNWAAINETPIKRAGLLARRIMIGLIRRDNSKKQNPSKPPKPPKSRAPGHPFKKIYSKPDRHDTSATIGHMGFGASQTAMEINEFGQEVKTNVIVRLRKNTRKGKRGRTRKTSLRQRRAAREKFQSGALKHTSVTRFVSKTVSYPERPFALPALQRTASKLPALWKNSISSATVRN